jgi:hypothetical protein
VLLMRGAPSPARRNQCSRKNCSEADVLLVRSGKSSCESRSYSEVGSPCARWKLLGRAYRRNSSEGLLVRGGNFSEGLVRGTPWKSFSCEAETPQKAFSCEVKESHASESTPRNSYVTEKQLQQMKFLLRNITFLT